MVQDKGENWWTRQGGWIGRRKPVIVDRCYRGCILRYSLTDTVETELIAVVR